MHQRKRNSVEGKIMSPPFHQRIQVKSIINDGDDKRSHLWKSLLACCLLSNPSNILLAVRGSAAETDSRRRKSSSSKRCPDDNITPTSRKRKHVKTAAARPSALPGFSVFFPAFRDRERTFRDPDPPSCIRTAAADSFIVGDAIGTKAGNNGCEGRKATTATAHCITVRFVRSRRPLKFRGRGGRGADA